MSFFSKLKVALLALAVSATAYAQSGTKTLYNKSGGTVNKYDVVVVDTTNNTAFTTTTSERAANVIGVVLETSVANNALGAIALPGQVVTLEVTGAVTRGDYLITSTTAGAAKSGGTTNLTNAFGLALETGTDTNIKCWMFAPSVLGSTSDLEFGSLSLPDGNGKLKIGTDDDIQIGYDETTDDQLEVDDGTNLLLSIKDMGTTGALNVNGTGEFEGALTLDDTSLKITEGVDTMTLTVPALTAARAVTLPDAAGEISLLGQEIASAEITDSTITYSDIAGLSTDPNDDRIAFFDDSEGTLGFLDPNTTQLSITATTLSFLLNAASGSVGFSANEAGFCSSGLVFEGATADTVETFLLFADPTTSDKTVTIPNSSGTVLLSGHTLTGDVAATLDTDGSTVTAFDVSAALSGDHALSANASKFGANGLIFEGATADSIEAYFSITDPTSADKTYTLPNLSGTVKVRTPVVLTAAGAKPTTSNGATAPALDANDNWVCEFGASDYAFWQIAIPSDYDGSVDSIKVIWYKADTNAVTWTLSNNIFGDGTATNQAYTTGSDTGAQTPTADQVQIDSITDSDILGASSDAGKLIKIRLGSSAFSGTSAFLLAVILEY